MSSYKTQNSHFFILLFRSDQWNIEQLNRKLHLFYFTLENCSYLLLSCFKKLEVVSIFLLSYIRNIGILKIAKFTKRHPIVKHFKIIWIIGRAQVGKDTLVLKQCLIHQTFLKKSKLTMEFKMIGFSFTGPFLFVFLAYSNTHGGISFFFSFISWFCSNISA